MKDGEFFLKSFTGIRGKPLEIITMPTYGPAHMSIDEANSLPWEQFSMRMYPVASIASLDKETEFIFVPKNVNWTTHDLTIFAGKKNDDGNNLICEFLDFSHQACLDLFRLHFEIARKLIDNHHGRIQFAVGYNPLDFSPGHHSLRRFHTHLRSLGFDIDNDFLGTIDWKDTTWFERLTVVEPFSVVYYDCFKNCLEKGLFSDLSPRDLQIKKGGYLSLNFDNLSNIKQFSDQFRLLYQYLKNLYTMAESIFTNRCIDPETKRYIPLDRITLLKNLGIFLESNRSILSDESISLLTYLARNLKYATRKTQPTHIESSSQVYITKGFAGAFSFTIEPESEVIEMDFFPRIITTTGPTKNIFGDGKCVGFKKVSDHASPEAIQASSEFINEVKDIVNQLSFY